jgi:hypothetical protein
VIKLGPCKLVFGNTYGCQQAVQFCRPVVHLVAALRCCGLGDTETAKPKSWDLGGTCGSLRSAACDAEHLQYTQKSCSCRISPCIICLFGHRSARQ